MVTNAKTATTPRRAELLAATSLAIDLGLGQPMEHMLRSCVLGMRLSEALGLSREQQDRIFYATLVSWIGCHADSPELAAMFGDDIGFRAATYGVDMHGVPLTRLVLSHAASTDPPLARGAKVTGFAVTGRRRLVNLIRSHCVSAGALARRLGIDEVVAEQLRFVFERWDGAGVPDGARGAQIPLEIRVVHLTDTAEVYLREGGAEAAVRMVRSRSGTQLDPDIVGQFCDISDELEASLTEADAWSTVMTQGPQDRVLSGNELLDVLTAMGDFADLKSPYTAGHSRGVAALAGRAAKEAGLGSEQQSTLHRAGLVHDLGRMGVSNAVWDKRGPLLEAERERVRLHPYLTERILRRVPGMDDIAALAGAHHERLDGTGYSRGTKAEGLDEADRILAAADTYQGWREPRPHRAALTADEAAARLRAEVSTTRLDGSAVDAVLAAAGHPRSQRGTWPAGLTNREVDVLRLIVRGRSSREIATALVIAPKTVRNHIEHIYAKLGVSNRIGATLFALQHGLVGPDGP